MNATLRGLLVLGIIVAFVGSCLFLSFGLLPALNSAVAVPVIMVPGEPYDPNYRLKLSAGRTP